MKNLAQISLVCLASTFLVSASTEAKEIDIFGIDISDSGPLTVDRNVSRAAGNLVKNTVARLQPGDEVRLRSFGAAGIASQQININVTIGRKAKARANRIAPAIGEFLSSLPDRVEKGQITLQTNTNIIGFVEAIAPSLDCEANQIRLILLTDGIEWSEQMNGSELIAGKAQLPPPSGQILKGCIVEMRGVGQQAASRWTDSRWFPILKAQWRSFFEAAGVARFSAYATYD